MFAGFVGWLIGESGAFFFAFAELPVPVFVTVGIAALLPRGVFHRKGYDTGEVPREWSSSPPALALGLVADGRHQCLAAIRIFAPCANCVLHPRATGAISGYFGSGQGRPTSPWFRVWDSTKSVLRWATLSRNLP